MASSATEDGMIKKNFFSENRHRSFLIESDFCIESFDVDISTEIDGPKMH